MDAESDTTWNGFTGEAIDGLLIGNTLTHVKSTPASVLVGKRDIRNWKSMEWINEESGKQHFLV